MSVKRALGCTEAIPYSKFSWNETPGWCSLCRIPIKDWVAHRAGRQATRLHTCLENVFQTYLREGNRRWSAISVYRDVGLLTAPFQSLWSQVNFSEHSRRFQLLRVLSDLDMPIFREGKWGTVLTSWYSIDVNSRIPGYQSLRPAVARCIMGMFPAASSGILTAFLHDCGDITNLEMVFHYLSFDHLFAVGVFAPTCTIGRCNVVKLLCDQLKRRLGERHLAAHHRVLAGYALRSLAAEVVIHRMEEYMERLEHTWREIGWPEDLMPNTEPLDTTTTTNPTKQRWPEMFYGITP